MPISSPTNAKLTAPAGPGTPLRTEAGAAALELLYGAVALAVTDGLPPGLAVALSLSAASTTALKWKQDFSEGEIWKYKGLFRGLEASFGDI